MGGHGALVLGLREPQLYKSISAFAPICHPVQAPWGKKAFSNYLGSDKESWKQYDAKELAQVSIPQSSRCRLASQLKKTCEGRYSCFCSPDTTTRIALCS